MEKKYYTFVYCDYDNIFKCVDDAKLYENYEDAKIDAKDFCKDCADFVMVVEVKPFAGFAQQVSVVEIKEF